MAECYRCGWPISEGKEILDESGPTFHDLCYDSRCPDFSHDDKDPRKCPTCRASARNEI